MIACDDCGWREAPRAGDLCPTCRRRMARRLGNPHTRGDEIARRLASLPGRRNPAAELRRIWELLPGRDRDAMRRLEGTPVRLLVPDVLRAGVPIPAAVAVLEGECTLLVDDDLDDEEEDR